ncbi:ABC-type multidrug transport system, permease component [Clostridium pasteurianum DSM 525 = ATCC 6013]|uniref:ABC-type multidrug transport system, permease component n=1 Tax=Clostridium pasteurianum DSM 525 = ATCC 6013 TaxID=1262449 RepID=A0A0H3J4V4_CLOPA|nr:ABC transporter permease [Clostridium pasteurianum]AJA46978.1 ABC-type multidrug transport system, permease component [Clostridium pasteurianum DSM 525 = ATCC 6013]AJA50966.1 ABC-type multidrug transport system, permease component [Clostridium pasteurianum DSM 525 = ATCC 6013]AOZ74356.1 hypothetical protein AQ983_04255 [Clostridium pasteurianum DSM 525 = ATCC 6013]AOZ78154.1 hypothetical protein AQ984_04260 [Clostridium pasteurianum]ELP58229.1 hypothetical protein F502_16045 [Clostridium pa
MKTISIFMNSLKLFLVNIKVYIFVFLIAPFIFSFMYGNMYKKILDPDRTIDKFQVAYIDMDKSPESKPLEQILRGDKLSKIVNLNNLSSLDNINSDLIKGNYTAAIVIPKDFSSNIGNNKEASIQVLQSPSAGVKGEIVYDIVKVYCSYLNMNRSVYSVIMKNLKDEVATEKMFKDITPLIEANLSKTYVTYTSLPKAKLLNYKQQFAPNMLIMFSLFIALTQAITVLKEREEGTVSRIYSTATSKLSFYFGKLLAVFSISLVQMICFLAVSILFIGVNFGNYLNLIPIMITHAVIISAITALLMVLFRNVNVLSVVFSFLAAIMSIFSGSFSPADYYPEFMRRISHFTVNYWINNLYTSNMLGDSFAYLFQIIAVMLVISAMVILLGAVKIKHEY